MSDLTDEAKAELKEAIRILREDGLHIHRSYARFQKSLEQPAGTPGGEEETAGKPPPAKDEPEPHAEAPAKRGLWWGDRS